MTKKLKGLTTCLFITNIFGVGALAAPLSYFHIENLLTQTITVKYAICDQNYQNCGTVFTQSIGHYNVFTKSCDPFKTILISSAVSKDGKFHLTSSCQTICSGVFRISQPAGTTSLSCQTS